MATPEYSAYEFGAYRLHPARRELTTLDGKVVPLAPKAFDALCYLVERAGTPVAKDALMKALWPTVIVDENALSQAISAARRALGDKRQSPHYIATLPGRGFQFVAPVATRQGSTAAGGDDPASQTPATRQSIRFCTTPDGVRLAYAISGEGSPVVRAGHWLTHVEYDWKSPIYGHCLRALSSRHTLIRYDHRGIGLSDWDAPAISLEGLVTDLEAVVAATGVERFALLGMSMGVPVAITYAVKHAQRISHLILYGGFAAPFGSQESGEALAQLMGERWGQDNPAIRQMMTTTLIPDSTPEEQQWLNDLQALSTSPENAARITRLLFSMNVEALLGKIAVPTLVIHARSDSLPLESGRRLAAGIPGARFVVPEGRNHLLLDHNPATARFLKELHAFIDS
jgi:DNA-binding winged helix-turn-helix (wHTH) protein/pimeloyl-ACP methyl ester carboxylesterase